MTNPLRTLQLAPQSPLYKKILERMRSRYNLAYKKHVDKHDTWLRAEERTLAYLPESEADSKRTQKRRAGEPKYTTLQIPYTFAMLMSAHTYWTSVFFARSPIHQYSGRHGEAEMQVQALEALIGYQVEVGQFTGPYYIWLYDAGKYGVGWLGQYWEKETIQYGQIVEMPDETGKPTLYQATQEVAGYEGNRVYNMSPYDVMPDPRVPVAQFQRGEFLFARKRLGWYEILRRKEAGYYTNIELLKDQNQRDIGNTDGSPQLNRPDFGYMMYESDGLKHPSGAVLWEMYIELVPSEWGVGPSNYPQKWCFTITETMEHIIGASPVGYIHGRFPFDVMQCEIEGYGAYGRGLPEIIEPLQNTMDWLLNSHFYNVRAAINNQFLVDPSRIVIKDVKDSGPGFLWRLRPEAYGTDIRQAFMQVPVNDVTKQHLGDIQMMLGIGERTLGVNDQIMGALNNNGRKTATEVRTTTGFGVNRLKTTSEYMSCTAFSPHSQKLVQTSQQCYDAMAKLRRVGSLAMDAGEQFINVSPDNIAGFFDFVPVDGTLPVDRMAQANLWKEILGGLGRMPPQIQMDYDWGRIFAWVATLSGLKNINQFKVQVLQPGQAPSGNVIPMQRPTPPPPMGLVQPGNSASTASGLNALGGESG